MCYMHKNVVSINWSMLSILLIDYIYMTKHDENFKSLFNIIKVATILFPNIPLYRIIVLWFILKFVYDKSVWMLE